MKDEITPALKELRNQLSPDGRTRLLRKMINDIERVTKSNLGETGEARPYDWQMLSPKYAKRVGRPYATLVLTKGRFTKGFFGSLKNSFLKNSDSEKATLTNTSPYADAQFFGNAEGNLPARQTYPIHEDGTLTEYQQARLGAIAAKHFQSGET